MDVVFKWKSYNFCEDGTYFCEPNRLKISWWRWNDGTMEWQHIYDSPSPVHSEWREFESHIIEGVTEAYCRWLADQIVGAS